MIMIIEVRRLETGKLIYLEFNKKIIPLVGDHIYIPQTDKYEKIIVKAFNYDQNKILLEV